MRSVEVSASPEVLFESASRLPMFSAHAELAGLFAGFVSARSDTIVPRELADAMYDDIAGSVLSTARYPYIPDLAVPVGQQLGRDLDQVVQHRAGLHHRRSYLLHLCKQCLWTMIGRFGLVDGAQVAGPRLADVHLA